MSTLVEPEHLYDTLKPFLANSLHSVTWAQDDDGKTGDMSVPGEIYYHIHVDKSVSRDTVLSALGMPQDLKGKITGYVKDNDTKVLYLPEHLYAQTARTKPRNQVARQPSPVKPRDRGFRP